MQKVCIGTVQSEWSDIRRGIPQGSILGTLIFTLYVNDLPEVVQGKVKQYADDTAMYCASDKAENLSNCMNADLARVAEWVQENGLKLNEAKTQMPLLSRKRRVEELEQCRGEIEGARSDSERQG